MSNSIHDDVPFKSIYPQSWRSKLNMEDTHIDEYRNLQHFKHAISGLTQKEDTKCGISYKDAVKELVGNKATMTQGDYEIIKNRVKQNLLKRGLISDSVYESYKYDVQGDIWDVARVIAQDPMCCLVPNETYTNHFYELYISASYPHWVKDSTVMENMAKILATVELLEREHFYCKITLVVPTKSVNTGPGKSHYLALIPLFSHQDVKTIEHMSSILNERLLRKFIFATWEDKYGSNIQSNYGYAVELPDAIRPVDLDECELASSIIDKVITPCERR